MQELFLQDVLSFDKGKQTSCHRFVRFNHYFCVMRFVFAILVLLSCFRENVAAQTGGGIDNVWSLQRCVQYAVDHNITIRQDSLTARMAKYTLLQSRYQQLPTLNATGSYGTNFGRSVNPTTNQFEDASYNYSSVSGNGNVLLFGWMQMRNTIMRNKYLLNADLAALDQARDDVSVNVATAFLTALLTKEQINVSKNQISLTQEQLRQTRAFANAGRLPELNVAQLESQLATDSSNLVNSIANYNSAVLDLKALLNLDFAVPVEIQMPEVSLDDQVFVSVLQPEEIYGKAKLHFGSIKGNLLRVSAAEKGLQVAKAGLYPQLSLGYQLGTNYASNYKSISGYDSSGPIYTNPVFGTQYKNNFQQSVYLGLNIPIFNGWRTQYNVRQAKVNLLQQQLVEYNAELTLKQNVYKAHNNAINSIQKYNAARRADQAATRALDFAKKRYDLGLTSTVDLLVTQNQQFSAASSLISAKYDLIFKLKVIDYYLGKELKL